ncbi:hypothetical protein H072_9051 [Dactylellina haptotyla CBS 200.50]|uniref:Uncharacterized protein n=1 Tax=Dactylellina haptotyla (strain CBS 200.50) TaxID=1284197 RepID=S8A866_DACHA|nr:hypothetical protein H072_9051 [Dactylellina haptotyla CBS 200.50]
MDPVENTCSDGRKESCVQPQETKERPPILNQRNSMKTAGDRNNGAAPSFNPLAPLQSKEKRVKKRYPKGPLKTGKVPRFDNSLKESILDAALEAADKNRLAPAIATSGDPPDRGGDGFRKFADIEMSDVASLASSSTQASSSAQPMDSQSSIWSGSLGGPPEGSPVAIDEYLTEPGPSPSLDRRATFLPRVQDHRGRPVQSLEWIDGVLQTRSTAALGEEGVQDSDGATDGDRTPGHGEDLRGLDGISVALGGRRDHEIVGPGEAYPEDYQSTRGSETETETETVSDESF